ncbi:MAG TPA: UvrD-helicase domain-containing protein [Tepidisphaeraceae bacterium]|nr:UvrD-helicase domain-containing protein [Tepidisphaeraceae bacterium]
MPEDLLEGLTDPQRAAVTHIDGPLLVIAGAGSGKTRVLTRRVAHLIHSGVRPSSILAITFTNKAAGEMRHRIADTIHRKMWDFGRLDQSGPMVCTFHSLCLRVLKHYAERVGLPPNFVIYDNGDQNKLIKDALKTLEISSTNFTPSSVHSTISNAKNQLMTAQDFLGQAKDFYEKSVARIFVKYQQLLDQAGALDFDDLLLKTVFALRDHPDVLAELQERFQYVLIDEYQDTNRAQYLMTHALAAKHQNICVVGDPDQSIYAWRGADLRNILDFERDYKNVTTIKLEQNYRSTKTILNIASKLISKNLSRKDKTLWTENEQGENASVIICQDEHDEARQIAGILRDMHDQEGYDWNKMAVFYRINSLSRVLEESLLKEKIPYQIARGTEFYNRKEIRDLLAYMRAIDNERDEVNLERIVNTPARGISDQTYSTLQAWGVSNGVHVYEAMRRVEQITSLNTRAQKAVQKFVEQMDGWRHQARPKRVEDGTMFTPEVGAPSKVKSLMERVLRESGLEAMYAKIDLDREEQIANLNELITSAAEFDEANPDGVLGDYLTQVALVSDADHMEGQGGAVTMMTLHAAKGLEFPVVAMAGLEEGVLPHARARGNIDELEEERRLAFVGITRAQERLFITAARYRTIRGLRERTILSPFLKELPAESIHEIDRSSTGFDSDDSSSDGLHYSTSSFSKGQTVRHPQFGIGKIAELSTIGSQTRAVIEFQRAGRKTLFLEYARLELV